MSARNVSSSFFLENQSHTRMPMINMRGEETMMMNIGEEHYAKQALRGKLHVKKSVEPMKFITYSERWDGWVMRGVKWNYGVQTFFSTFSQQMTEWGTHKRYAFYMQREMRCFEWSCSSNLVLHFARCSSSHSPHVLIMSRHHHDHLYSCKVWCGKHSPS